MTIRAKLTVAFSAACLFLIAVGIAAIVLVQHLNDLLDTARYYDTQAKLLAYTLEDLHRDPAQTYRHLANLNELKKYTRPAAVAERNLIQEARSLVAQNPAGAMVKLDALASEYRDATEAVHNRLQKRHHSAVIAVIISMIDGLVLLVVIMNLVRHWLLHPVEHLQIASYQLAAGDLDHPIPAVHDREFVVLTASLGKLAGSLRQLRERVAEAERLAVIGEACSHVTHGLRTPLATIRALAVYERDAERTPAEARAAFAHIVGTVDILERWVRDTISSVRPVEPQLARKPVEPVVRDVLSLLQTKLNHSAVRAQLEVADGLPDVEIDRALLEQALVAILDNAIEASPRNGQINLRAERSAEGGVALSVQDHGDGMPESAREKAFDSFFSTKPDSAGLGLAIAQRIVGLHHGTIDLESQPDQGTRVVIKLPPASVPSNGRQP